MLDAEGKTFGNQYKHLQNHINMLLRHIGGEKGNDSGNTADHRWCPRKEGGEENRELDLKRRYALGGREGPWRRVGSLNGGVSPSKSSLRVDGAKQVRYRVAEHQDAAVEGVAAIGITGRRIKEERKEERRKSGMEAAVIRKVDDNAEEEDHTDDDRMAKRKMSEMHNQDRGEQTDSDMTIEQFRDSTDARPCEMADDEKTDAQKGSGRREARQNVAKDPSRRISAQVSTSQGLSQEKEYTMPQEDEVELIQDFFQKVREECQFEEKRHREQQKYKEMERKRKRSVKRLSDEKPNVQSQNPIAKRIRTSAIHDELSVLAMAQKFYYSNELTLEQAAAQVNDMARCKGRLSPREQLTAPTLNNKVRSLMRTLNGTIQPDLGLIRWGTLSQVEDQDYDIVCARINELIVEYKLPDRYGAYLNIKMMMSTRPPW